MKKTPFLLACLGSVVIASVTLASEPGWEPGVIKFGAERQEIRQKDVLNRPYRPLHVYGNTVRRRHYRGRAIPMLRDITPRSARLSRRG